MACCDEAHGILGEIEEILTFLNRIRPVDWYESKIAFDSTIFSQNQFLCFWFLG
jgi:hypothetical protein